MQLSSLMFFKPWCTGTAIVWSEDGWVFQAHSLVFRMLNWVIMSGNCVLFYGEVDTCLLVNRHRDDPPHFAQVTKQPRDGRGYWPFTKLCLTWVHGWEMKGSILHYQSLGPASLPKEAFHLVRQLLAHGNRRLGKKRTQFQLQMFPQGRCLKATQKLTASVSQ